MRLPIEYEYYKERTQSISSQEASYFLDDLEYKMPYLQEMSKAVFKEYFESDNTWKRKNVNAVIQENRVISGGMQQTTELSTEKETDESKSVVKFLDEYLLRQQGYGHMHRQFLTLEKTFLNKKINLSTVPNNDENVNSYGIVINFSTWSGNKVSDMKTSCGKIIFQENGKSSYLEESLYEYEIIQEETNIYVSVRLNEEENGTISFDEFFQAIVSKDEDKLITCNFNSFKESKTSSKQM